MCVYLYIYNASVWPRHSQYSGEVSSSDQESKVKGHVRPANYQSAISSLKETQMQLLIEIETNTSV